MLSVGQHLSDDAVFGVLDLRLGLAFQLGVFAESVRGVRQGDLEFGRAVARLAGVGLVHDDGEVLLLAPVHLFEDEGELLERRNDDADPVVDGVAQSLGALGAVLVLLVVDQGHQSFLVLEAVDGVLQLLVENSAVGHDDDGGEDGLVGLVVEPGEAVGRPRNAVGLAAPGAVLYEVVPPRALRLHVGDQLADHIQLVIAGEDDLALFYFLDRAVGLADVFLFLGVADELLEDVEQTVLSEHLLPDVAGDVVGVLLGGGIALAAVPACAAGALIEGQEAGLLAVQFRGHGALVEVHGHEDQHPAAEAETGFPGVAGGLPLDDAVAYILTAQLVLELDGHDRDPVDGQHHVHAVAVIRRVVPLPDALAGVGLVFLDQFLVEGGLRPEEADAEVDAPVLEAVTQHIDKAVLDHLVIEALEEALFRVVSALPDEPLPHLGLGPLHEVHQRVEIHRLFDGGPVARIGDRGPAALGGGQPRLNVGLEVLFGILTVGHQHTLLFPVTVSKIRDFL